MRKFSLSVGQMSPAAFVSRAAWWSRELTRFRARGPGDLENAMRAIERDYGISFSTLWRLRYKAPQCKSICVSIYARLEAAYRCECERQRRRLEHEISITKAIAGADSPAVRAAQAVVDAAAAATKLPPALESNDEM